MSMLFVSWRKVFSRLLEVIVPSRLLLKRSGLFSKSICFLLKMKAFSLRVSELALFFNDRAAFVDFSIISSSYQQKNKCFSPVEDGVSN